MHRFSVVEALDVFKHGQLGLLPAIRLDVNLMMIRLNAGFLPVR